MINIKKMFISVIAAAMGCAILCVSSFASVGGGSTVTLRGGTQAVDSIEYNGVKVSALYPGYQCAELVMRFYTEVYGFNVFNLYSSGSVPVGSGGEKFLSTREPRKGDIVRFQDRTHWALVKNVSKNGTVTIIEQNWNMGGYVPVNRTVHKNDYAVTFFTYEGYYNAEQDAAEAAEAKENGRQWFPGEEEEKFYNSLIAPENIKSSAAFTSKSDGVFSDLQRNM